MDTQYVDDGLHFGTRRGPQKAPTTWGNGISGIDRRQARRTAGGNRGQNREISGLFFPEGFFRTGKRFGKTGKFPGKKREKKTLGLNHNLTLVSTS